MPHERATQIPAERAQLGKYKFEIRRFTSGRKTGHAPAGGTKSVFHRSRDGTQFYQAFFLPISVGFTSAGSTLPGKRLTPFLRGCV